MTKTEMEFMLLLARAQHEQTLAIVEILRASAVNANVPETSDSLGHLQYLVSSNNYLDKASNLAFPPKQELPVFKPMQIDDDSLLSFFIDMPIRALPFNERTKSVLTAREINYVGKLVGYDDASLLKLVHFGPVMLNEVKNVLGTINLSLEINLIDWKPPTKSLPCDCCIENFSWIYIKNVAVYLKRFSEIYPDLQVEIGPSTSSQKDLPKFGIYVADKNGGILKLHKLPSYNELVNNLRLIKEGRHPV